MVVGSLSLGEDVFPLWLVCKKSRRSEKLCKNGLDGQFLWRNETTCQVPLAEIKQRGKSQTDATAYNRLTPVENYHESQQCWTGPSGNNLVGSWRKKIICLHLSPTSVQHLQNYLKRGTLVNIVEFEITGILHRVCLNYSPGEYSWGYTKQMVLI